MKDQKEIIRETNELKILEAAELVFAQFGFKGATTDKIAKQAELPKANIHYYYKTKANLYQCVLTRILKEWIEAAEVFDDYDEPKMALTKYVESKMNYSRCRPYASKVWANEIIHGAPVVGAFLETTLKKWLEDRVEIIKGWIASNKIRKIDPTAFIYMIWSVTQHYADFEKQIEILNKGKGYSDEEFKLMTEQVTQFVLAGAGL
ncbi:MAG: TetR family transcriptional regulator [Kangiella sp.]|nr:MAG: TetR family transcriptional regulator [Kangiella sp.]